MDLPLSPAASRSRFELVAVAFVSGTGGSIHVLFVVDRDGVQLFEGEPAVLVEHRHQGDPAMLVVEVADVVPESARTLVAGAAVELAAMLDAAHDQLGGLVRERLVGASVTVEGHRDVFGVG